MVRSIRVNAGSALGAETQDIVPRSHLITPPNRLTVCTLTRNSAASLELWASSARKYAHEIVIAVDASSDDGTYEIARRVADRVFLVEHPGLLGRAADWLLRQATGEWVLLLDDDEVLGSEFAANVSRLLASTELTHYYLNCRWVVRQDDGGLGWLVDYPWGWHPCRRLFRNIGSLFWHPLEMHTETSVLGAGRLLADTEGTFYHFDLLWRTREQRERKVWERYGGACREFYLFEEGFAPKSVVPVGDPAVIEFAETTLVRRRAADAPSREGSRPTPSALIPLVSLDEMVAVARRISLELTSYGVEFLTHDTPSLMGRESAYYVHLTLKNTSDGAWGTGFARDPVYVSYHWWTKSGEEVTDQGLRSHLLQMVAPDETVAMTAHVLAPSQPGKYVLEWDMVQEGVCWFGQRGASTLCLDIEVNNSEDGRPAPDEMVAVARRISLELTSYGVEFLAHDTPSLMGQESAYLVHLTMKNTSDGTWGTGFVRDPVYISYHWWTKSGEEVTDQGLRSHLLQMVAPDETVAVTAHVLAPSQPGKYVLEWDVVQEGVCWFGQRGASTLCLDIEVNNSEDGRPAPSVLASLDGIRP